MVGYSMCWDAYKSSICSGFSSFQQNGEFVDMTLAADSHFVKVHQALIAMVSPYLKALITSAPCQHPVIFLNNVSYKTLSSLLEYVYTGEVVVPTESLTPFIQTAKALHIKGLEDLNNMNIADSTNPLEDNSLYHVSGTKRLRLPVDSDTDPSAPCSMESKSLEIDIPAAAKKILVKHDKKSPSHRRQKETSKISTQSLQDYDSVMDVSVEHDSDDDGYSQNDNNIDTKTEHASNSQPPVSSNVQYSVSIRGSLQVILNRYIYNLHTTPASGLRRWRCVEYRNNKCMAFLVTKGNVVVNRANLHNHSFHDRKILQKIKKNAVFSAIDDVKEYQLKEKESNAKEVEVENRELPTDYKFDDVAKVPEKTEDLKSVYIELINKSES